MNSDADYLDAVQARAPASTSDVADEIGVTRQGADYRLRKLEANGLVESTTVGNSLLWSVVERDEPAPDPTPSRTHERDETPTRDDTDDDTRRVPREIFDSDAYTEPIPGDVDRDELLDAIAAALSHLESVGAAKKPEFVREVMPDHPLKYDVEAAIEKIDAGERERGKWWRLVRDGLASHPRAHKPENNARPWRYINRAE